MKLSMNMLIRRCLYCLLIKTTKEMNLISFWHTQFRNAMIHKAPYTKKWLMYLDANIMVIILK